MGFRNRREPLSRAVSIRSTSRSRAMASTWSMTATEGLPWQETRTAIGGWAPATDE